MCDNAHKSEGGISFFHWLFYTECVSVQWKCMPMCGSNLFTVYFEGANFKCADVSKCMCSSL